jgi:phage tail-like protein
VVRRITAEFDGSSSLDLLPAIYRSDAAAEDFTRRLVSLFDASLEEIDDAVRQAPRLFHPQPAEARTLTAIAAAIGIRPDPSWPAERLGELLNAWPRIWPALGTPDGLKSLITVLFGIDVRVDELGGHRPWASLSAAPLGAFRLFGTARASLRLGTGPLGVARLDPGRDPLGPAYASGAFRCVVHAPSGLDGAARRSLESVVQTFAPGHVVAEVRYASASFVVGRAIATSVGTRLGPLIPGVLNGAGEPAFVLTRRSLLGRRRPGGVPVTVGRRPAVGITTRVR